MADAESTCGLCGLPMPEGEEMFKFHGYSGPCPGPALPAQTDSEPERLDKLEKAVLALSRRLAALEALSPAEYPVDLDGLLAAAESEETAP